MKKLFKTFIAVISVLALTYALLIFTFTVRERCFIIPVPVDSRTGMIIRNDNLGEGHFGAKRSNSRTHTGVDIACKLQTAVYAAKSGWAICSSKKGGYGNLIQIYHPDGFQTRYAHLDRFTISPSQWVYRGDLIGYVGKSGNAGHKGIKPHLHFEIRRGKKAMDPEPYLNSK